MVTNPVTKAEILSTISSLKSKTSSGYDGISTEILKISSLYISEPFAFICNMSLMTGVFPDQMKYADIKPLFKKGDKSDMTNYRPMSMLPTFSKVLEKIMYHRLNQHFQINDVLVGEQFGFHKNMAVEFAAYLLTNEIHQAWNRKSHVVGIFAI
jgi:hypothetical protein